MKNRIGIGICVAGFLGVCAGIMALDSDVTTALVMIVISILVGAVGYLMTDFDLVMEDTGYTKTKDSKIVQMRKKRNQEIVWRTWIATKQPR